MANEEVGEEIGPTSWMRLDKILRQAFLPILIVLILYPIIIIAGANESPIEEWFGGRGTFILINIIVLPPCSLYFGALYKIRKDKWVKLFEIGNNEMIGIITDILKDNNLPFKRRSEKKKLPGFPISFAEIFDIDNGRILIGVQRMKGSYSAVDIGPIREGKGIETLGIDVLREMIDLAYGEVLKSMKEDDEDYLDEADIKEHKKRLENMESGNYTSLEEPTKKMK